MPPFSAYLEKIRRKLTQVDIEEDPSLITARAFRRRVLDEQPDDILTGSVVSAVQRPVRSKRVAVYNSPGIRFRLLVRRFGLIVLAPLFGLGLVAYIVLNTLAQNQANAPLAVDTTALDNVPVPARSRPISRQTQVNLKPTVTILIERYIPNYLPDYKGSASYISPLSVQELTGYYNGKMVEPRPPPWQIYGTPAIFNDIYTTLYIRPLNAQGAVEAVILQLEPVKIEILRVDQSYYDNKAQVGETVIIISKAWLARK